MVSADQRSEFTSLGITFHLMDASDPCQERNLPREVVQALFEEIECGYWLVQALIHLRKKCEFSIDMQSFGSMSIYPLHSKSRFDATTFAR